MWAGPRANGLVAFPPQRPPSPGPTSSVAWDLKIASPRPLLQRTPPLPRPSQAPQRASEAEMCARARLLEWIRQNVAARQLQDYHVSGAICGPAAARRETAALCTARIATWYTAAEVGDKAQLREKLFQHLERVERVGHRWAGGITISPEVLSQAPILWELPLDGPPM